MLKIKGSKPISRTSKSVFQQKSSDYFGNHWEQLVEHSAQFSHDNSRKNSYGNYITGGGAICETNSCGSSDASVGQKGLNVWRTA